MIARVTSAAIEFRLSLHSGACGGLRVKGREGMQARAVGRQKASGKAGKNGWKKGAD